MFVNPRVQIIVLIVGVWGGAIAPIVFAIYYTIIANWWSTVAGRTIMAMDLIIGTIRLDRLDNMLHHSERYVLGHSDWLIALAMCAIPAVIFYRIGAFEARRRRVKSNARKSAEALSLVATGLVP